MIHALLKKGNREEKRDKEGRNVVVVGITSQSVNSGQQ
jgi:hypothetical protein